MLKWSLYYSAITVLPIIQMLAEMSESHSRAESACFIFFPLLMLSAYIQVQLYKL